MTGIKRYCQWLLNGDEAVVLGLFMIRDAVNSGQYYTAMVGTMAGKVALVMVALLSRVRRGRIPARMSALGTRRSGYASTRQSVALIFTINAHMLCAFDLRFQQPWI